MGMAKPASTSLLIHRKTGEELFLISLLANVIGVPCGVNIPQRVDEGCVKNHPLLRRLRIRLAEVWVRVLLL